ncbi:MAG: replication-associated recombination protein A [Elusimicrobia bacterium]|nr:replication-associated recombination protein A [Elusimicrobiota bacterium]
MPIPLAVRMSPKSLSDFAGQEHLLGEGKLLRRAVESGALTSAVFYGPSGSGKSALAKYIVSGIKSKAFELNAALAGVQDLRKIIDYASGLKNSSIAEHEKIFVILDEIHHFNRTQQDVLLPSVEKGEIILIGITTENPFFYINRALLSRFMVFEFKPLNENHLRVILENAVSGREGLKELKVIIEESAKKYLILNSSGDARRLLNALELAVLSTKPDSSGRRLINAETARESIQKRTVRYDRSSDEHYDHVSAFIKSMRGSDPDAAVYWLAKMLSAGEDPLFIARRIVICASEDVGNANPNGLVVAQSAFDAVDSIGMPEARIILSHAAIYIACSPKSNASNLAINQAIKEVENGPQREVPLHLRDANQDLDAFGHGKGYKYPHDFPNHYVKQEYMPEPGQFYTPSDQGFEQEIAERLKRLKEENK